MRLKKKRLKTLYHKAAVPRKDSEGNSYVEYGQAEAFQAEEWPGGGKQQAEMYGIRLPNIRNCRIDGRFKETAKPDGKLCFEVENGPSFTIGDGICIFSGESGDPDYKIVAIYPYRFLALELERI